MFSFYFYYESFTLVYIIETIGTTLFVGNLPPLVEKPNPLMILEFLLGELY